MKLSLLFFSLVFFSARGSAPGFSATPLSDCLIHELNKNALTPINAYRQPNRRQLGDYQYTTGIPFEQLQPGDLVLDSGGGFGLPGLKLANSRDIKAVVINAQDVYASIRSFKGKPASNILKSLEFDFAPSGAITLKNALGYDSWQLRDIAISLGMDHVVFDEILPEAEKEKYIRARLLPLLESMISKINSLIDTDSYRFHAAFSEDVIGKYKGQVQMLTDIWGAYAYSPERWKLIPSYYDALTANGEARVFESLKKMKTYVETLDHRRIPFTDYLVEKYPTIFSIVGPKDQRNYNATLVIKRDSRIQSIDLPLELITREYSKNHKADFSVAEILLKEKQTGQIGH